MPFTHIHNPNVKSQNKYDQSLFNWELQTVKRSIIARMRKRKNEQIKFTIFTA